MILHTVVAIISALLKVLLIVASKTVEVMGLSTTATHSSTLHSTNRDYYFTMSTMFQFLSSYSDMAT